MCGHPAMGKTRWPPWLLIGWDIFNFSSETPERNSRIFDRKPDLYVLYKVCVFRADRKKQDGRPGLWLAETFSTSSLKPLNRIQRNLKGSKISTSSTKFVFFGPIGKKQDGRPGLWLAEIFSTSPLKLLNGIQRNFTGSKISASSIKFVGFFGRSEIYWFCTYLVRKTYFNQGKIREISGNFIPQNLWPPCDRKNKMAALASDWLRHFQLLLRNPWTEFKDIWQEARSLRPLQSLCFSGGSEKTRWPPWPLIGWDIFAFFSDIAERNSTKLDRKQDLNILYLVCVSRAD